MCRWTRFHMWVGLGVLFWCSTVPIYAYAPIDDVVASVMQMGQSGEISDGAVLSDLTVRLQTIGALIDGGDTATARSLLTDFSETVQGFSGSVMTSSAATQLVNAAQALSDGL